MTKCATSLEMWLPVFKWCDYLIKQVKFLIMSASFIPNTHSRQNICFDLMGVSIDFKKLNHYCNILLESSYHQAMLLTWINKLWCIKSEVERATHSRSSVATTYPCLPKLVLIEFLWYRKRLMTHSCQLRNWQNSLGCGGIRTSPSKSTSVH